MSRPFQSFSMADLLKVKNTSHHDWYNAKSKADIKFYVQENNQILDELAYRESLKAKN